MKKTLLLACMVALYTANTWAQQENNDEIVTIFGKTGKQSIGGYGALNTSYGQIDNKDAIFIGARGAVIINHSLAIGLGGNGFISETIFDNRKSEDYEYAGGYGGFYLEPIIGAKKPVHFSFPVLIGAGGIGYVRHWGDYDNNSEPDQYDEDSDAFFIFEPGVEVEFNLLKFMRVAVSGSYRLTSKIDLNYKDDLGRPTTDVIASSNLLRGFSVGVIMKFGKF